MNCKLWVGVFKGAQKPVKPAATQPITSNNRISKSPKKNERSSKPTSKHPKHKEHHKSSQ